MLEEPKAERQASLNSAIVSNWPLLGLTFAFVWTFAPYLSEQSFSVAYRLGFAGTLLLTAALFRSRKKTCDTLGTQIVASCAMCTAPLCTLVPHLSSSLAAVFGLMSGLGAALCFSCWFTLYAKYDTRLATNTTLLSFFLSSAIRFVLVALSSVSAVLTTVFLCISPFLSLIFIRIESERNPGEHAIAKTFLDEPDQEKRPHLSNRWGFVLEVFFYGLAFGFMRDFYILWSNSTAGLLTGYLIRVLLPLFLIAWINIKDSEPLLYQLIRYILAAIVIAFFAVALFLSDKGPVVSSIALLVRNFTSIMINIIALQAVRDVDENPFVIYGVTRGFYELALALGQWVFSLEAVSNLIVSPRNTIFLFVALCILVLLCNRLNSLAKSTTRMIVKRGSIGKDADTNDIYGAIATKHSLSPRETEIMELICRGRSKRYIAETLFLSEETVRWHTKQLYLKLGIHSKQELITLVEEHRH